jgi:dynein intermediate chain 2
MSGDSNTYVLKREFFSQPVKFNDKEDTDLKLLCIKQDYSSAKNYEPRNPKSITLGNVVEKSSHYIHTEKTKTISVLMKHTEGGWPDTVKDPSETREVMVWKRKTEKEDPNFAQKVKILIANTTSILKQNLRMDIYEEYFDENEQSVNEDNFYAKIKSVFKDSEKYKRTVAKVVLSLEEDQTKIAVAYRLHKNQIVEPNYKLPCLVWDINNPNTPINILTCNSEITTVAFNSKHTHLLGAGCSNGTAVIFDLTTNKIIASTKLDESHSETICDFIWLKSKTGTEFVTTSTDGRVMWWDIKNLFPPTIPTSSNTTKEAPPLPSIEPEKPLILIDEAGEKEYGGMKIEYNPEAGSSKKKNEAEIQFRYGFKWGRHLGPVSGMQRCPVATKVFLTVGDWTARVNFILFFTLIFIFI